MADADTEPLELLQQPAGSSPEDYLFREEVALGDYDSAVHVILPRRTLGVGLVNTVGASTVV